MVVLVAAPPVVVRQGGDLGGFGGADRGLVVVHVRHLPDVHQPEGGREAGP